jgi:hypothetical protein
MLINIKDIDTLEGKIRGNVFNSIKRKLSRIVYNDKSRTAIMPKCFIKDYPEYFLEFKKCIIIFPGSTRVTTKINGIKDIILNDGLFIEIENGIK